MKNTKLYLCIFAIFCFMSVTPKAQASSIMEIFSIINAAGTAINSVSGATRSAMSTFEMGQRVTDRTQERGDKKRAEKAYSDDTEEEYYRTLEETQTLQNRMKNKDL